MWLIENQELMYGGVKERIEERNRLISDRNGLMLEQEKIRNERLFGGYDNADLRNREQDLQLQINEIEYQLADDNSQNLTGGANYKRNYRSTSNNVDGRRNNRGTYGNRGNTTQNRGHRQRKNDRGSKSFLDDWQTEDFELFTEDAKSKNSRKANKHGDNDYESWSEKADSRKNSRLNKNSYDDDNDWEDDWNKSGKNSRKDKSWLHNDKSWLKNNSWLTDSDEYTNQERPRDEKADEMYRSFIKKIMDLLGVDEETARLYRSVLKINLENNNPELRKRENDALKIKELENLMENKKKLQAALDKIDIEKIKKFMEERRKEGEKIREERKKQKKDVNQ